ncbi:MAG TPA: prepilin-type N-terminal cleavage/methylation domain-containing protein [Gammaproteobacteria bacterium]|nr:prepilin-type N-terminal cleavage/methylation domain-containing protein [Gammaproteobacteria bacterium]
MTRLFPGRQRQQGFSLVEIMVALTLGLVLLGGAITLYAGSKDSYRLQENIAGMQENARFAIHALRRDVEMAGYPLVNDIVPFVAATTTNGNGAVSDQITIQYLSRAPATRDCLGNNIAAESPIINRYFIGEGNDLRCQGNNNDAHQSLVEDIHNMQALYGIDDDNDSTANRYVRADQVGAGNWGRVVSLRVALLVASNGDINATQQAGSISLLDTEIDAPDDNRLYRVFTTTIPLRNRIP